MDHLTLKAVATTTDAGLFDAVISTESVDRENDVVVPGAMVDALRAWTETGKRIPLAWNHSAKAEDIVGHIDPASVREVAGEVVASGWVDQDTDRGRNVWRLAKSGTLGFSFGYLVTDAVKRADGIREIRRLDVFEVSATPTPMNNGTRVLSTKAVEDNPDRTPTQAELEREMIRLGLAITRATAEQYANADPVAFGTSTNGNESKSTPSDAELRTRFAELTDPEFDRVRTKAYEDTLTLLRATETKSIEPERESHAPVQVARFEC